MERRSAAHPGTCRARHGAGLKRARQGARGRAPSVFRCRSFQNLPCRCAGAIDMRVGSALIPPPPETRAFNGQNSSRTFPPKANRVRFPGGAAPRFSHAVIVPSDAAGRRVFSGISHPSLPPFHSGAAPYSLDFTLIGSPDLDVRSHPNLFTYSFTRCITRFLNQSSYCLPRRCLVIRVFPSSHTERHPRMERRWNTRAVETGIPRENRPTSGIAQHRFPHAKIPGVNPPEIEPGSPWWEASALATAPPLPSTEIRRTNHILATRFPLGEPGSILCRRIFACGNRGGRCHWSAGYLEELAFPPPLHFGAAPYLPRFTLIGSQDLDVMSRPNIFAH
ncbi:hypothetical protein PR048_019258 [Dryococelus australis]|uniref:Uncharacterized protein n=1 Tax=Dryococelus australis TaxID=614101 RepID=A0ABQ9H302_9NEOP|nr:hypothetical protein PR048_019258 [Dryococelus australis]